MGQMPRDRTETLPLSSEKLDSRTREARFMRRVIADLTAHVGGHPTLAQRALIDRIAWLSLHCDRLDTHALAAGHMSEQMAGQYLAWSNSLTRALKQLGPSVGKNSDANVQQLRKNRGEIGRSPAY
jgi:hypothetical protein